MLDFKNKSVDTTLGMTNAAGTPALIPYPAVTAGDILWLFIVSKYPTDTAPAIPSGWTACADYFKGNTPSPTTATGTGATRAQAAWKVSDGTETGNVSVTLNGAQSGRMLACFIMNASTTAGNVLKAKCGGGFELPSSTAVSMTMDVDPGFQTDDLVFYFWGMNNMSITLSGITLNIPGCVVGTLTNFKDNYTAGQDAAAAYGYCKITSGTSSGPPVLSMTASSFVAPALPTTGGNPEGGALIVRMREQSANNLVITGINSFTGIQSITG
jgi:hypothetical protein